MAEFLPICFADIAKFEAKTEVEGVILWNRLLVYATLFGYTKTSQQGDESQGLFI